MLDWKDYAFAAALLLLAFVCCLGGLESALERQDAHAVEAHR